MKHTPLFASRRAGFSLLELMLVLAIIGVLTAIAAVSLTGQGERAKRKATRASMDVIKHALDQYNLDKSTYPATLAALQTGKTPYLDADKPLVDGWKQPFLYQPGVSSTGHPYDLISKGADGQYPSSDDVNLWIPDPE